MKVFGGVGGVEGGVVGVDDEDGVLGVVVGDVAAEELDELVEAFFVGGPIGNAVQDWVLDLSCDVGVVLDDLESDWVDCFKFERLLVL